MTGCKDKESGNRLIIAISKGGPEDNYKTYGRWIQKFDPNVQWLDMSQMTIDKAVSTLGKCSGLILTGGPDVNPARYGKSNEMDRCQGVDDDHDTLELALLDKALKMKMPVLGICRGQQLINVYMGGTLVTDIHDYMPDLVRHNCEDKSKCFHSITITPATRLFTITGQQSGEVNSSHHQAVEFLAKPLIVSAMAPDGIMEAIEWKDPAEKSPLLAVQWHPERLDTINPMSKPIALDFLNKAREYLMSKK
jgi:putative glutamine amidotransferase